VVDHRLLPIAAAVVAALSAPSPAAAGAKPAPAPAASPGVHEQLLQPGDRRYTIAIPRSYDGRKPMPLVVALHFGGPPTPYIGRAFLEAVVAPGLQSLGAILVAPDCTGSDWTGPRSERDLLELLDFLLATYPIDPAKVLLTGYSMGGIGAWHLASRHQDRFAAVLIMAGKPSAKAIKADWRLPLYVIHSRDDEIVPLRPTERAVAKLRDRGVDVELVVLEGITHYQSPRYVPVLEAAVPWIRRVLD